jgi:Lrp/AsnC family leucine-responsive transcriptional regulator
LKPENWAELLDDVNRRLLAHLQQDPRLTMSALARLVGMSSPAVTERVQRLERAGVIRGYRLDVDPAALGLPVTAWVRVRPGPRQLTKIADLAAGLPNVSECHRITGEDCFLIKLHAATIESVTETLDKILLYGQTVERHGDTRQDPALRPDGDLHRALQPSTSARPACARYPLTPACVLEGQLVSVMAELRRRARRLPGRARG